MLTEFIRYDLNPKLTLSQVKRKAKSALSFPKTEKEANYHFGPGLYLGTDSSAAGWLKVFSRGDTRTLYKYKVVLNGDVYVPRRTKHENKGGFSVTNLLEALMTKGISVDDLVKKVALAASSGAYNSFRAFPEVRDHAMSECSHLFKKSLREAIEEMDEEVMMRLGDVMYKRIFKAFRNTKYSAFLAHSYLDNPDQIFCFDPDAVVDIWRAE